MKAKGLYVIDREEIRKRVEQGRDDGYLFLKVPEHDT